jgi:hypothetical protein
MTRLVFCAAIAICITATSSVYALPPMPGLVNEAFKNDAEAKTFMAEFGKLKMKCDLCHKPGADKKAKDHGLNDFGEAMHKSVNFKEFKAAMTAKDNAALMKLFNEGYAKAAEEKNADGKTYGELIKAGSLPGKNG